MEKIFTNIYETKEWGDNNNINYNGGSGPGSTLENTIIYNKFLKKFIVDNNIRTVVDCGCGDFNTGPLIYENLDIFYTGYDAYQKVVDYNSRRLDPVKYHFEHLDIFEHKEMIKDADLCILKDVLQHWSLDKIYIFLDYLVYNKKFKYILICNCSYQKIDNTDIKDGRFRPLSCDYFPLKKYNPKKLLNYLTKEISVIEPQKSVEYFFIEGVT